MCVKTYRHTLLYDCPCSNRTSSPRVLNTYSKKELDVLLAPSQKVGYHYYKRWFWKDVVVRQEYCNTCLRNADYDINSFTYRRF